MKNYKLKIPIGELFKFLNIDNELYDTLQPSSREVKIKTPSGEYTPILSFVKKSGWIRQFNYEGGHINCDENHKIKQLDGSFKFISETDHVIINNKPVKLLNSENRRYGDVYDIALNNPHEYVTSSGIVSHNTTLARLIVNSVDCDHMIINASDENNVDTVRNKIKGFASTIGFKPFKIIVLDEADYMTAGGQSILRNLMETFSKHCRFILTCNYVEKIIDPIQSRCQTFQIIPPTKKDVAIQISKILTIEGIKFEVKDLVPIIDTAYPDIRKIINTCQLNSIKGELKVDTQNLLENDYKTKIIEILKSKDDQRNKYMKLRQTLVDSRATDFTDLYTLLYDKVEEYAEGKTANVILEISDGQRNAFLSIDKEIPTAATLIKILNIIA
jgi:DNA polymerase III delta prime subunit